MNNRTVQLPEILTIDTVLEVYESVQHSLRKPDDVSAFIFDFSNVRQIDSAGVVTLEKLSARAADAGIEVRYENISGPIEKTINTFSKKITDVAPPVNRRHPLEYIGEYTYSFWTIFRDFMLLLSSISYYGFIAFFRPKLRRKGEVIRQGNFIGVSALPIIALVGFLIGLVLTLQAGVQMRPYGAEIFVAQLITFAMIGELGPLLTAIMIAGRSGSAIAAEIGSMKVSEEIDALRSMGIDPVPYLIIPKLFAILMTMPLLTAVASYVGIFGGAVIGYLYLQIDFNAFYNEVVFVLRYYEIMTAFVKSIVFATIIIVVASYYGLHVEGGAEGVGKSTTRSVVVAIFLVILADSILGLIFYLD
jgi:phospholipid/cholesterol/gamma-HCH transport system permease protein